MRKQIIGRVFCQDGEYLWCYDEIIGALSRINTETMEADCIVSPMQIFKEEAYEVGQLILWKDAIIIVPIEIGKNWIIYKKETGQLSYSKFSSENFKSETSYLNGDKLTLIPVSIKEPIVVIDLLERMIVKKVSFPDIGSDLESFMEIYDLKIDQRDVCFLIRNSFFYGRFSEKEELKLIRIQSDESLACADFSMGAGWAVNGTGSRLYHFDKEGNLLKSISINEKNKFGMMILEERKIFLLPVKGTGLKVFDIDNECMIRIDMQTEKVPICFQEMFCFPDYWYYLKKNDFIWILPLKYPLQIINVETLECKSKSLEYSNDFSLRMYREYHEYAQRKKSFIFQENSLMSSFGRYLELVKQGDTVLSKGDKMTYGKKIWRLFK